MDVRTMVAGNHENWVSRFGSLWEKQVQDLKTKFGDSIENVWMPPQDFTDVPVIFVRKESILPVLKYLKESPDMQYQFLSDITASDESPAEPRFEIIYQLFSHEKGARIRIKAKVSEGQEIDSAVVLWLGANWAEREIFDMYGVRFIGHPDLRRILMDQRWEGHPLRKDYPLRGYQIFPTPEIIDPKLLD